MLGLQRFIAELWHQARFTNHWMNSLFRT